MEKKYSEMTVAVVGAVVGALVSGVIAVIIFVAGNFSTQTTLEKKTVETLASYFDSVDKDMSYKEALQFIYEDSKKKDDEISGLNTAKSALEKQISESHEIELASPSLIVDGLKLQDGVVKGVAVVDGLPFYSGDILNQALGSKIFYDSENNTVLYSPTGANIMQETKISLFDTDALYDGVCYWTYSPSEGHTISMGSSTYNQGFAIGDDHSLFGAGCGYALFDLKGKYSKISFDVGRTNEYNIDDVTLKVYLNGKYETEYKLSAQSPPKTLTIDLKYANDLKLEITGGSKVKYGFANVILHY